MDESIGLYLQPEELSGDNQYFCNSCETKTDALRGVCFAHLPPILTLQLRRFDYDTETWERIKLDDYFEFPFDLNMKKHVMEIGGNYSLFAVLVHSGNALGGHYFCYIKSDGNWFFFSSLFFIFLFSHLFF